LLSEGRTAAPGPPRLAPRPGQFRRRLDGRSLLALGEADRRRLPHSATAAEHGGPHPLLTPLASDLASRLPERAPPDTSRQVVSPMPGLVISIEVTPGQEVRSGETLAVIEAMKMQNILRAERDGVVKTVGPKAGDSVAADEVLIEFS
jgi:propionyl-CoA carboxylase alpha chain